ncbi:MAG: FAD-binding protein [Chloroflexota bacterium]|nr:FAD-binding protein [Chloroflexota bacterium]
MTRKRYDLVVIGAGMAGNAAANKAASLGAQVAIIEKDKMGGAPESMWDVSPPRRW